METPATIRRNPPRKAKLASAEKSAVKDFCTGRSARKRCVREGKALISSFTAAGEDRNPKLQCSSPPQVSKTENFDQGANRKDDLNPSCMSQITVPPDISEPQSKVHQKSTNLLETVNPRPLGSEAQPPQTGVLSQSSTKRSSAKVCVFLRIRPAQVLRASKVTEKPLKTQNLQHGKRHFAETIQSVDVPDICLVSQAPDCVTLATPSSFSGPHRPKAEDFNGFSRIFSPESTQTDVFDGILAPRLADLLKGESSLVVAMGPTSAGKTHTMLGTSEDPGLLPRTLRYLLGESSVDGVVQTITIVISMFEIYSEQGGRSEKILDLLQDGAELSLQQSKIKGLHEAVASTVHEADAILLIGLQKRTTASTAANHQSSRSHCIINISTCQAGPGKTAEDVKSSKQATLTIADLAGFERERKTGNQGVRLNESNFINNTSMVFGQCLRALLEHQKNPKKALHRHYQYSMLTRYLKLYMEGKGNMTLIVNVSPCEEDYVDTAFVLRQAAPYSNIKLTVQPKENRYKSILDKSLCIKERNPAKRRKKVEQRNNSDNHCQNETYLSSHQQTRQSAEDFLLNLQSDVHILPHEVDDSKVVAGVFMEGSRIDGRPSLQTFQDFKPEILAEVKHILCQGGVQSSAQVAHAILQVLEKAMQQHFGGFQAQIQQQHAESSLLSQSLLKEQEYTGSLLKELEDLKEHCRDLEKQLVEMQHFRALISTETSSPTDSGRAQAVQEHVEIRSRDNANPEWSDGPQLRSPLQRDISLLEDLGDQGKVGYSAGGKSIETDTVCDRSEASVDLVEFEDCLELASSIECKPDIPHKEEDEALAPSTCTYNAHEEEFQVFASQEDMDAFMHKVTEGGQCNGQGMEEGQPLVKPRFKDVEIHGQQRASQEHLLTSVDISMGNMGNTELNQVMTKDQGQIEEHMRASTHGPRTPFNKGCESPREEIEQCNYAENLKPMLLEHEVRSHEDLEQCTLAEDPKPILPEPEVRSEAREAQKLLGLPGSQISERQMSCTLLANAAELLESSPTKVKSSNLQKGRLLALSLMQEAKSPHVRGSDHHIHKVNKKENHGLSTAISREKIGPIGHELQEMLGIPLTELEKGLCSLEEEPSSSMLSDLLQKNSGALDINQFSRKYSPQRSYCLRYCLAVLCGKMSVDGKWVLWSKATFPARERHFLATIQAKTVAEAAGHAQAGFHIEALSDSYMNGPDDTQDKENSTIARTANASAAPAKRRRLQPLSSLSLHGGPNMGVDMELMDANVEEVHTSKLFGVRHTDAAIPGKKSSPLAYLLAGQKQ